MPETTPLLPRSNRPPHEHPIFLRVCHSPWYFIGQRSLLLLRSLTAIYLTAILGIALDFEINTKKIGDLFAFNASHISFVVQVVYYWITALWTLQHLLWPRNGNLQGGGFVTACKRFFSIPRTTDFHAKSRLAFSVFYTCATTFPFVVTFLYWFVVEETRRHKFELGGVAGLVHLNMSGVNALIALVEIMILSSVRKPEPFVSHLASILMISGQYFVWAFIGHAITGEYVYRQLDPEYNGVRGLIMTIVTSMSLTVAFLLITLSLHQLRDYATAKAECDRQNV